ncbi:MAG: hypothetical protein ACREOS_05760, partial [Candidatus Dormibacteraceae bacterium]
MLEDILSTCHHPNDDLSAVLLFEYLTRPRLVLRPSLRGFAGQADSTPRVRLAVELACEGYQLRDAWDKLFQANIGAFAATLAPTVTEHLQAAHAWLRAAGSATERWDPISFDRSAIEPNPQDDAPKAFDVLIDAARDVVGYLVDADPRRAEMLIDAWATSDAPLLRRLALYGMSRCSSLDPDRKLRWLIGRDWLYAYPLKHEVFQLLKAVYGGASPSLQGRILRLAERGPRPRGRSKRARQSADYETYNLLNWLAKISPTSVVTEARFRAFATRHPEFAPREHADFDVWSEGGWVEHLPPVTADEMLRQAPAEVFDLYLTYESPSPFDDGREAFSREIGQAVAQSSDWGWRLVEAMLDRDLLTDSLWHSVIRGWRVSGLGASHVERITTFVVEHPVALAFTDEIADYLLEVGRRAADALPDAALDAAKALAEILWSGLELRPPEPDVVTEDWLLKAINHPAGHLVQFWLSTVSAQRSRLGGTWTGLGEQDRLFFEHSVTVLSANAALGRVILASQLHFLNSVDRAWTQSNVIPLFDWERDIDRAIQAWHGFLTWGHPGSGLLDDLMPLYERGFGSNYRLLGERRSRFVEHLA